MSVESSQTTQPRFSSKANASGENTVFQTFIKDCLASTDGEEAFLFARRTEDGTLHALLRVVRHSNVIPSTEEDVLQAATQAERNGTFSAHAQTTDNLFIATRIDDALPGRAVAVVRLPTSAAEPSRALDHLRYHAAQLTASQLRTAIEQVRDDTRIFAHILDLMVLLDEQTAFASAAMLLCNQLAARFNAERVSLGWLRGHDIRVEAISHSDRFDRKSAAVKALAAAMEEAIDQDDELLFPAPPDATTVTRLHVAFAREQGVAHLASVPLRIGERPVAVLTLERASEGFSAGELRSLRLTADHAANRLDALRRADRWFGARLAAWARQRAAAVIGVEHTGRKLVALSLAMLLAVLVFVKKTYRVEAPFTVRSDAVAFLPAPFDGYIGQVHFRIGDAVAAEQPLVRLDTRELSLEEAAALAEQNSYLAEAQKAQSGDQIAEMQIALAKSEQARARLERARYRLSQAAIRAPFAGIVAEGDLRERIGAPVKQGEVLLKLAQIAALYSEASVSERSINDVMPGASAELAFASRPQTRFPVRVERVEPVASASEKGNNFTVRCLPTGAPEDWWRPGMTGICKIDAGKRSLLWILTHRTVEFLRLYLWW